MAPPFNGEAITRVPVPLPHAFPSPHLTQLASEEGSRKQHWKVSLTCPPVWDLEVSKLFDLRDCKIKKKDRLTFKGLSYLYSLAELIESQIIQF